jgi:pyruvate/2-oxoglutarate dehydrogenase complex dihydrolipoamide dehydrogenase (E3) component
VRDLVVIGGGWAGTAAALAARAAGLDVVLVEARERAPRALAETALAEDLAARPLGRATSDRRAEAFRRAVRRGGEAAAAEMDRRERLLGRASVDRVSGRGRLSSEAGRVDVEGSGRGESVRARAVLIATGSRPASDAPDDRHGLLDEPSPPESAIVVGGGSEGVVLAGLLACAGTRVTLVERQDRVLPRADADVSAAVARALTAVGATLRLGATATAIEVRGASRVATVATGAGTGEIEASRVLIASGRRPEWGGLDAPAEVLAGLPLPEQVQATALPWLFAAGSATGRIAWPEASQREGRAVVELVQGRRAHVPYHAVPRLVAGAGGAGWAGLTEAQCRERGHVLLIGRASLAGHGAVAGGFVKVLVDAGSSRLLGVHAAGALAREAVVLGALALEAGLGRGDLAPLAFPASSHAEALVDAVAGASPP